MDIKYLNTFSMLSKHTELNCKINIFSLKQEWNIYQEKDHLLGYQARLKLQLCAYVSSDYIKRNMVSMSGSTDTLNFCELRNTHINTSWVGQQITTEITKYF
jgi:hypothetical protein